MECILKLYVLFSSIAKHAMHVQFILINFGNLRDKCTSLCTKYENKDDNNDRKMCVNASNEVSSHFLFVYKM